MDETGVSGGVVDASRVPVGAAAPSRKLRRDDEIEVVVAAFDERGFGVARHEGQTVRLRRASVGDRLRVRVTRRRRDVADAIVLERLERGAHAVEARCAHFGNCGGCTLQDLDYAGQLAGKRQLVDRALRAAGLLERVAVEPVVGASDAWRYRNKMEFTFASRRWVDRDEPPDAPADFALGLHASGYFGKVVDVASCAIQSAAADPILATARELARAHGLEPWDVRAHTGLLRYLVVRTSRGAARGRRRGAFEPRDSAARAPVEVGTDAREAGVGAETPGARGATEILVVLVTSTDAHERVDPYLRDLLARHPEITTLVHSVNTRLASTAIGERERVVHGAGFIHEHVGGLDFAISAGSFFQVNPAQAEKLFAIVVEEARLSPDDLVFDLYCGTGSIALSLARRAREVVGFEQVASAIVDARRNAELNAIANARFVEGDVLVEIAREGLGRPDVLVVDPPRAGLHPKVPAHLVALGARRIVYVSCNPVAAARDLAALVGGGYAVLRIRPVDLFPHTPHVECVVSLVRAYGEAAADETRGSARP